MSIAKNKKEIERHELEKFVSNDKLKLRVVKIENSETPDFEIVIDGKLISIEHSRLVNPKLKKEEQYRNTIIHLAKKKFNEKYPNTILYVNLDFKRYEFKGGQIEKQNCINDVFSFVEEVYLINKDYDFRISSRHNQKINSKLIQGFSVNNILGFENWQHYGAYKVDWVDMDWLAEVIKGKEKNIIRYQKNFFENWLLLTSNYGNKSSAIRTDFIDFSVIRSQFDKVFIYNYMEDEVVVLK